MIWLIGNKGMLGADVELKLKNARLDYVASDMDVDITDFEALRHFVKGLDVAWILNCSAYTAVDKAEDEPNLAYKINADGVLNIAKVAREVDARLIHLSTDYVFDGNKTGAYTEDDNPNPTGVYGESKLKGEKNILNTMSSFFIFRISWLYGEHGNNFVQTMLRLFSERDEVSVVADQWGSPTLTVDVADLIVNVIKNDSVEFGIYNFTNKGKINWYEFATEIYAITKKLNILNNDVNIIPIKTEEYPTRAKRPKNSYLSKDKIKNSFGIKARPWKDALEAFIADNKSNSN